MTEPFIDDPDFRLYVGDVRTLLAGLPTASVDCVVTSPPYWGLRDYGTGDTQIGLEETPGDYVEAIIGVFREVRRVLADHGTVWLNLDDSYVSSSTYNTTQTLHTEAGWKQDGDHRPNVQAAPKRQAQVKDGKAVHDDVLRPYAVAGLAPKNLVGIPWHVAFALQDDGWILRSDIIWAKPNPMPESVTDRPTKSHEYVFLLSKQPRYYFDQEAVRERYADPENVDLTQPRGSGGVLGMLNGGRRGGPDGRSVTRVVGADGSIQHRDGERWPNGGRNVRSVWSIATQPYSEAHFATFPEALPRRCIQAGCPEWVCRTCGKPRERIVELVGEDAQPLAARDESYVRQPGNAPIKRGSLYDRENPRERRDHGWSDCGHDDYRAGVVLDPFLGSGTTALVARRLARHAVGVELNPEYAALCARRLQQLSLFAGDAA